MTDQSAQEPTMEEILASIRRIISEDDAPADTAAAPAAAAPEAEPEAPAAEPEAPAAVAASAPEPVVEAPAEDDVLELTDRYEAPAESVGDIDVVDPADEPFPAAPHPTPIVEEPVVAASTPAPAYDSLVGESAAASAASAFAGLHASFKKPDAAPASSGPDLTFASGSTVEAMVAEMLRPMLKDWLDANLPGIVQQAVQKEVERIARSA